MENLEKKLRIWNTVKRHKICVTGVPEGEEKEIEQNQYLKRWLTKNFPKETKNTKPHTQEMLRSPGWINTKETTSTPLAHKSKIAERLCHSKSKQRKKEYYLQSSNDWLLYRNNLYRNNGGPKNEGYLQNFERK